MSVRFLFVFDLLFNLFRIALWPSVGKELSPWLFSCAIFVLVPSCLEESLSCLVFRAGCGIWLYRFLIIAFLSTLNCPLLIIVQVRDFYWQTMCWFQLPTFDIGLPTFEPLAGVCLTWFEFAAVSDYLVSGKYIHINYWFWKGNGKPRTITYWLVTLVL